MHVLIVDESPAERQRLRALLEAASGAPNVSEAGSLAGVRHQIDRGRCDAVLLGPGTALSYRQAAEEWAVEGAAGVVALASAAGAPAPGAACVSVACDADGAAMVQALVQAAELAALRRELAECREALRAAQDRVVEATSLKLEFLANLSHEVRTPLQGVFEMVELLRDTPLSERQQRYLDTARTCGERLLDVVTDVLTLSDMVTGRFELEEAYFDVRRIVQDAVAGVAPAAGAKELRLECDVAAALPWVVRGDGRRLGQIIGKLLANAVKFTDRGSVSLSAAVTSTTRAAVTLRFEVRDTGVGIAPERLHRIFHSFSQADGSSSRSYEGTGLGLAIAKRFVERMGGDIHVESEPGVGSTFWFAVPLRVDAAVDEAPAHGVASGAG